MAGRAPIEHECDRILIVEGYSDLHFYAELLRSCGCLEGVFIKEFKGKANILDRQTLEIYLNEKRLAEKKSIGVLVDADDNPSGTAQALQDHLKAITGQLVNEGSWTGGPPRLGFLVVPDGKSQGELESLVWDAFPDEPRFSEMKQRSASFTGPCSAWDGLQRVFTKGSWERSSRQRMTKTLA